MLPAAFPPSASPSGRKKIAADFQTGRDWICLFCSYTLIRVVSVPVTPGRRIVPARSRRLGTEIFLQFVQPRIYFVDRNVVLAGNGRPASSVDMLAEVSLRRSLGVIRQHARDHDSSRPGVRMLIMHSLNLIQRNPSLDRDVVHRVSRSTALVSEGIHRLRTALKFIAGCSPSLSMRQSGGKTQRGSCNLTRDAAATIKGFTPYLQHGILREPFHKYGMGAL